MKKLVSFVMVLCMLMLPIVSAQAALPDEQVMQPYGSCTINGYLFYDTSRSNYVVQGTCFGVEGEQKTVSVILYKQINGDSWSFVASANGSGTAAQIIAETPVDIDSGYYRVVVSASTTTHSGSSSWYYNV